MQLIIDACGNVRCVYGEEIDLRQLGPLEIRRGSHVEPDADGRWIVDLSPVGGPVLGPYETRSSALQVEKEWLEQNWQTAFFCECEEPGHFDSGVAGILAHVVDGQLATGAKVERCDLCERYESDAAALAELVRRGIAPPSRQ